MFDSDGTEWAVAARKVEHTATEPGWSEVDMDRLWLDTCDVIQAALRDGNVEPDAIAAVTCTGHGNGLYLVDADGRPVRAGIGGGDARAADYIERWAEDVHERVLPKTMQSLWPGQPNAILAWLKDHEPESLNRAKWLFMVKDYTRFRLTGEAAAEISDLSGTSLIDVGRGEYDPELLDIWGLADLRPIMPPIVQIGRRLRHRHRRGGRSDRPGRGDAGRRRTLRYRRLRAGGRHDRRVDPLHGSRDVGEQPIHLEGRRSSAPTSS